MTDRFEIPVTEEPLSPSAVVEYVGGHCHGDQWIRADTGARERAEEFRRQGDDLGVRLAATAPWFGLRTSTWADWRFITSYGERYRAGLREVRR